MSQPGTDVPVDAEAAPSGRLRAIWIKRFKRGPMDPHTQASLVAGRGLVGNANQGGRRQVTLLTEEGWAAAISELGDRGAGLAPSLRRANLLISGLRLEKTRGRILRIGNCRLRVFSETTPCHQMDEAWPGLQRALRPAWRGGVCAEVMEGGEIEIGDVVRWEEPEEAPLGAFSNPRASPADIDAIRGRAADVPRAVIPARILTFRLGLPSREEGQESSQDQERHAHFLSHRRSPFRTRRPGRMRFALYLQRCRSAW